MSIRIAFIGAGRMATAIIQGLLKNHHYQPEEIACTCGSDDSGAKLAEKTGIHYLTDISPAIQEADAFVLACKPQQFDAIDDSVALASPHKLVLSIMAGITVHRLSERFPRARNIVRTMPNTPGQIGAGVTAYATLHKLPPADRHLLETLLSSLGNFHAVDEPDLDAVTALSGSGPAYVFEFASALRDAGIQCGLNEKLALSLTIDTLLGTAKLLSESTESPEALRDAVTSKGGTTAAALKSMEQHHFRTLIQEAVKSAKERSQELSQISPQ